jgi:hypothetical protein
MMPQIIVTTDRRNERGEGTVMWRERINVSDFESGHFTAQLLERLGWAVNDAHEVDRQASDDQDEPEHPARDLAADGDRPVAAAAPALN